MTYPPPRAVVDPARRTVGLMAAFAVLVVPSAVKLIKNSDKSYIHPIYLCVVKLVSLPYIETYSIISYYILGTRELFQLGIYFNFLL